MTRPNLNAAALLVIAGLFTPCAAHAAESYDNCSGFIDSVPAVITTQGTWCLRHDLTTAISIGSAITINTNNVTIDCNHFKIGGLAAGIDTFTDAIYAIDRQNLTVRNCNIRGFFYALYLGGSGAGGGHMVEDNRVAGNTYGGIDVHGDGSVVRRNLVLDTGGSTVGNVTGIFADFGVDVLDNTISGVTKPKGVRFIFTLNENEPDPFSSERG